MEGEEEPAAAPSADGERARGAGGKRKQPAAEEGEAKPRPRWLTPRECARLMGFPEAFVLHPFDMDSYRLLGNAVCPPIVALVGGLAIAAAFGTDAPADAMPAGSRGSRDDLAQLAVGAAAALLVLATPDDERRHELLSLIHI